MVKVRLISPDVKSCVGPKVRDKESANVAIPADDRELGARVCLSGMSTSLMPCCYRRVKVSGRIYYLRAAAALACPQHEPFNAELPIDLCAVPY